MALLACATLAWGLLQTCERAGAAPWTKAAWPAGSLSDLAESAAPHEDGTVPAGPFSMVVEQAMAWTPDLKSPDLGAGLPVPIDMEHDQPDHMLPPPALACCLAPPSVWTLQPRAGIDLVPLQGLLRPPDLG